VSNEPAPESTESQRTQLDASELTPEQIAELAENSIPAVKRRAPKYKAFFFSGAVLGIVIGLVLGLQSSLASTVNRGVYLTVTVAFATLITSLIAGFIALQLDNRSVARAEAQKKAIV
jgi:Mg/Co/Ni transporter MgtE